MYEEFKQKMLADMEMRRDIIVLENSKSYVDYESLFEVSNSGDKIYRRILDEFDRISVYSSARLVQRICCKHGIKAEETGAQGPFDLLVNLDGEDCYIEFRSSPRTFNSASFYSFVERVKDCKRSVYLVYLVKDSVKSRRYVARQEAGIKEKNPGISLRIVLFEDFTMDHFGFEELILFKKAMANYKEEMHQAVGYQVTEIFNSHNLELLKRMLIDEFPKYPYDRIKEDRLRDFRAERSYFRDLSDINYARIKEIFLEQGRYNLLLGNSNFSKSFLTSEWLYKKYFSLPGMDNTFIVTGYLKSMEQMLWNIINIIGEGRQLGDEIIQVGRHNDDIRTTLGNMEYFITDYSNDDLYDRAFGENTHFVMQYLRCQLSDWRSQNRNGYLHKDNLEGKEAVETVRDETYFLYMLILGSLALDEEALAILSE